LGVDSEGVVTPRLKAVIFDFDGTLARTMEDNFRAWESALGDYRIRIKPEDYYPLEGLSVYELPKRLFSLYQAESPEAQEVVKLKERYYLENHRFEFYPGVETLLKSLRAKKIPMAIVTAGLLDRLDRSVPAGFLRQFQVIVTGDQTKEGKPSPAPYLRGVEQFGLSASDCFAIENAPLGIQSAKGAGLYCIAVCSTLERHHLGEADEVVNRFEDLKTTQAIQELLK